MIRGGRAGAALVKLGAIHRDIVVALNQVFLYPTLSHLFSKSFAYTS